MKAFFLRQVQTIQKKRISGGKLSDADFRLLAADCILDRDLFKSPKWNWRYGGVRYESAILPTDSPSKILILQWPGSLGDVVMAAPLFSLLRQKYPGSKISFLSSRTAPEIFLGNPDIDVLLENPLDIYLDQVLRGQEIAIEELIDDVDYVSHSLKTHRYDLLINLQILPMSAALAKLAGVKQTIGMTLTDDGMPIIRGNIWTAYLFGVSANLMRRYNPLHRTEIFNRIVDDEKAFNPSPSLRIDPDAMEHVQSFLDRHGIGDDDRVIGISPMAASPTKTWKHYDELLKIINNHLQAWVIIFGTRNEDSQIDEIIQGSGKNIIKATHFNLQEFMAALCGCDVLITNDTGPMHLACLLKRKLITLFGPTRINEVGPWRTEFHALQSIEKCEDCFGNQPCRFPDKYCMEQITVNDVFNLLRNVLDGTKVEKTATNLIYQSSDGPGSLHSGDSTIGRLILNVLENKKYRDLESTDLETSIPITRIQQCLGFKERLEAMIRCINSTTCVNSDEIHTLNKEIFQANSFIKPIIAINDFKFLDKRRNILDIPDNYRKFIFSTLKDIDYLLEEFHSVKKFNLIKML